MSHKDSKPLIMSVGTAQVVDTRLGYVVTRTNGVGEYMLTEWADLVAFLRAYHGAWDDDSAAMWRFTRLQFAPTTLQCYFNWVEAGKPVNVIAYCDQVLGDAIRERSNHMRDQFAKASKAAAADRLRSTPGRTTEFSQATILELHLNQRFPRA